MGALRPRIIASTLTGLWKRPSSRRGTTLVLALVLVTIAALSCGPSVQSIYEGDVRFEHCYRLDLDLNIAASHREACWKQWMSLYTYGQPRDRIEYARRRLRAFSNGDFSRPTLNTGSNRPARREYYLVVPEPTSAHAPPPPVLTPVYGPDAGVPVVPAANPTAPGTACATGCYSSFNSCKAACGPDGGVSEAACKSCEPDYRQCMRRCYE